MDQKFITGCRYFLKKRRLYLITGTNQKLFIRYWYFSCFYSFVTLWHIVLSLPYLLGDCLFIFSFVVCGALVLLFWLKSKKYKENASLPSLMSDITRSHTNISLAQHLCKWLQDWTRWLIEDGIIHGNQQMPMVTYLKNQNSGISVRFLTPAAVVRVRIQNEARFMARLIYCLGTVFVER